MVPSTFNLTLSEKQHKNQRRVEASNDNFFALDMQVPSQTNLKLITTFFSRSDCYKPTIIYSLFPELTLNFFR